jgi:glycopeptide antibiotics resistance protein
MIKHLFWLWLILLLLLNVLPLGGDGQQLNRRLFSFRLDYLLHSLTFLPFAGIWLLGKRHGVRWFERNEAMKFSLIVFLAAIGFELLQRFTTWRTFNWVDMAYNVIGAACGIVVIALSTLLTGKAQRNDQFKDNNMRDFTLQTYSLLLRSLSRAGYSFQRVEDYMQKPVDRVVVLRHDVDLRNYAALRLAKLEASFGVKSTYYFRVVKQSYNPEVIRRIVGYGHEVGYHYEDLATHDGDYEAAIEAFQRNLERFRKFYPVKTVCMHGSSGSPYDNRDLWKRYKLEDFGIICEPYLSIDYDKVLYLSDTGRRWNGFKVSLRDNVESAYDFDFRGTKEIINAIEQLPNHILFTAHPEQWVDNLPEWLFVKAFATAHTIYKVCYRNKRTKAASRNQS